MVPQDMCDAMYKNKGIMFDCNNHRGVFLLGFAGKAFARVIFPHIKSWLKEYIQSPNVDLGLNVLPLI